MNRLELSDDSMYAMLNDLKKKIDTTIGDMIRHGAGNCTVNLKIEVDQDALSGTMSMDYETKGTIKLQSKESGNVFRKKVLSWDGDSYIAEDPSEIADAENRIEYQRRA